MSELCSVNWYRLFDDAAADVDRRRVLHEHAMPGTAASFGLSDRTISSALISRSLRGLRCMNQPALVDRAGRRRRRPRT